jgi:hypothetical protein
VVARPQLSPVGRFDNRLHGPPGTVSSRSDRCHLSFLARFAGLLTPRGIGRPLWLFSEKVRAEAGSCISPGQRTTVFANASVN